MIIYIHHRTEVNGISVAIGSTEVEVSILTSIVTDGLLPFIFYLQRLSSQSYRNPFDISRLSLLEQVSRMRTNFLHSSANTPHLIEEGMYMYVYVIVYTCSLIQHCHDNFTFNNYCTAFKRKVCVYI